MGESHKLYSSLSLIGLIKSSPTRVSRVRTDMLYSGPQHWQLSSWSRPYEITASISWLPKSMLTSRTHTHSFPAVSTASEKNTCLAVVTQAKTLFKTCKRENANNLCQISKGLHVCIPNLLKSVC